MSERFPTGLPFRDQEVLAKELAALQRENAELKRRLAEAESGSRQDRETRRAALNLTEDAVQARRAEQREVIERRRMEEELREANRRKDEFLATLAHELRNPLAPLRNSLEILRLAGSETGAAHEVFEMMDRQVNHMVRLIDDLMEVSRITRGKIELRMEHVDLASIVRHSIEISRPQIDAAHHEFFVELPNEPLMLFADSIRLSQVLANLLNNAAKYTDERGKIWLKAWRDDNEVVISVKDSGLGIPRDMLSRVFDLFTQIDRDNRRCQGGLGIGLTLVQQLVMAHGGHVEAYSDGPRTGSEFCVRLPLSIHQIECDEAISESRESPRVARHQRILVVDDNRDAALSVSMLLKLLGAEVSTVHDGASALEEIAASHPDVVLLDIGMPEMDGHEVARRTRLLPHGRNLVLIALTGWGQEEDRDRCREAGFDHHLLKPVQFLKLRELLASLPTDRSPAPFSGN